MNRRFLPLMVLATAGLLASCDDDRGETAGLRDRVEDLNTAVATSRPAATELRHKVAKMREENAAISEDIDKLLASKLEIQAQQEEVKKEMQKYRLDYHVAIRQRAAGMTLGELTAAGRLYHEVIVKSVDEEQIVFRHRDGFGRALLADVPPDLQALFSYDPALSSIVMAQKKPEPTPDETVDQTAETPEPVAAAPVLPVAPLPPPRVSHQPVSNAHAASPPVHHGRH